VVALAGNEGPVDSITERLGCSGLMLALAAVGGVAGYALVQKKWLGTAGGAGAGLALAWWLAKDKCQPEVEPLPGMPEPEPAALVDGKPDGPAHQPAPPPTTAIMQEVAPPPQQKPVDVPTAQLTFADETQRRVTLPKLTRQPAEPVPEPEPEPVVRLPRLRRPAPEPVPEPEPEPQIALPRLRRTVTEPEPDVIKSDATFNADPRLVDTVNFSEPSSTSVRSLSPTPSTSTPTTTTRTMRWLF
jgi:hypothetical protein